MGWIISKPPREVHRPERGLDADEAHRRGRLEQERDALVCGLLVLDARARPQVRQWPFETGRLEDLVEGDGGDLLLVAAHGSGNVVELLTVRAATTDLGDLFRGECRVGLHPRARRAVASRVVHVLGLRAPREVGDPVVGAVAVPVPGLERLAGDSAEGLQHKDVNKPCLRLAVLAQGDLTISAGVLHEGERPPFPPDVPVV
jgi:hypothetical protein